MKKLLLLLLIVCSTISSYSQSRITNYEGGLELQSLRPLGIYDGKLYYLNTTDTEVQLLEEDITDNVRSSELVYAVSLDFDLGPMVHQGKFVVSDGTDVIIYNLGTQDERIITPDENAFLRSPFYSENSVFFPTFDELYEIDMDDFSVKTKDYFTDEVSSSFTLFYDFDEYNLRDSFVLVGVPISDNGETELRSYNLHTGEFTVKYSFDENSALFNVYSSLNTDHGIVASNNNAIILTITYTEDDIIVEENILESPVSLPINQVYDNHVVRIQGSTYFIENFTTGEVNQYEVNVPGSFVDADYKGYYYQVDQDLLFTNYEGTTTTTLYSATEPDGLFRSRYGFLRSGKYIDEENLVIEYYTTSPRNTISLLVNDQSAQVLSNDFWSSRFKDPVSDREIILTASLLSEESLNIFEQNEVITLTENQSTNKEGGQFIPGLNSDIYFTRNAGRERVVYFIEGKELQSVNTDFTNFSNTPRHGGTSEFFFSQLQKINRETKEVTPFSFSLDGLPPNLFGQYGVSQGSRLPIKIRQSSSLKLGLADEDGIVTLVNDPEDRGYNASIEDLVTDQMGNLYTLFQGDISELPVWISADGNEVKTLTLDDEYSFFPQVQFVEGDRFMHCIYETQYLVVDKATGEAESIIEANYGGGNSLYFEDGIMYSSNGMYKEAEEEFVEFSRVDNKSLFESEAAYFLSNNVLVRKDLNTDNDVTFAEFVHESYLSSKMNGQMAFANEPMNTVLFTDGTNAGTTIITSPEEVEDVREILIHNNNQIVFLFSSEETGTELVALNTNLELITFDIQEGPESSLPENFKVVGDQLYFSAKTAEFGRQLYRLDLSRTISSSEDLNIVTQVSLYPNPTSDFINIDSEIDFDHIQIIDLSGRLVQEKSYQPSNAQIMSVNQLGNGTFFARLSSNGKTIGTYKFIKS